MWIMLDNGGLSVLLSAASSTPSRSVCIPLEGPHGGRCKCQEVLRGRVPPLIISCRIFRPSNYARIVLGHFVSIPHIVASSRTGSLDQFCAHSWLRAKVATWHSHLSQLGNGQLWSKFLLGGYFLRFERQPRVIMESALRKRNSSWWAAN